MVNHLKIKTHGPSRKLWEHTAEIESDDLDEGDPARLARFQSLFH